MKQFWESINSGTNILAVALIGVGAYMSLHGDKVTGGCIVTGGFTLLNNSKKVEPTGSPLAPTTNS